MRCTRISWALPARLACSCADLLRQAGHVLRRGQAAAQQLLDGHLPAHAARLDPVDEALDDGLDDAGADRPAGVLVDLDSHGGGRGAAALV